jgi:integrase
VHQHITAVLSATVEDGRIVKNPAVGVKLPEVVKAVVVPLRADELWRLADAAPPFFRAAVLVGAGIGLRSGETLGLTLDRVDWLRREVRIDRQMVTPPRGAPEFGPPKTRASNRTVPAPSIVLEALSTHIAEFGLRDGTGELHSDGLVFHTRDGAAVSRNRFSDWWRPTASRSGLPRVRYHDLRHHFASALIASGCG